MSLGLGPDKGGRLLWRNDGSFLLNLAFYRNQTTPSDFTVGSCVLGSSFLFLLADLK
jgi:hypothetical protein